MASLTLGRLAELLNLSLPDSDLPADTLLTGIAGLLEATPSQVSFCSESQYAGQLANTKAAAVIVAKKVKLPAMASGTGPVLLIVDDADLVVNRVLEFFAPPVPRPAVGVDPMARVDPTAVIGEGVRVGPFVVVGARAQIGKNSVLHPGVVVADESVLGESCELFHNVVIRERCTIGHRVTIHAGSVVGSDGFGYRWDGKKHAKVPQIGTVTIGDDVEIGSCTCIDRAKFSATVVGPGTKIDNLVQVGHNVRTGAHCIIVGQVGLAGSVHLGNGVILGGQSAIRDHIKLGDGAMVAACSGVAEDVDPKMVVSGLPALPHRQSLREQAALRRLPELVQQMRKLNDEINQLKTMVADLSE